MNKPSFKPVYTEQVFQGEMLLGGVEIILFVLPPMCYPNFGEKSLRVVGHLQLNQILKI